MGAFTSRQNAGVEEVDIVSNHAYKYPPKSGNYFGSQFIMGGERFDTPQPEAYLFGENADLNFLGSRPTPFPYPPPQANEPTKTLKSLVNIRKESLRLVRAVGGGKGDCDLIKCSGFNIEFTFDCDARTAITIYYFAQEEITPNGLVYIPRDLTMSSETYYYKRGSNQLFTQPSHIFDPSRYTDEELSYNPDKEIIPVAIHCVAQEGTEELRQSHTCIAVIERHSDGTYMLKALKQKLFVDGLCYLLQEIYGIENKSNDLSKTASDEETEDNGSECVICICDVRDTLILPCRHLCLCNSCADSLRYQANNCPICRAPFRALLQIRALQKASSQLPTIPPPEGSCENIPAGYEPVSLIEALNGPCLRTAVIPLDPTETSDPDSSVQAADVLNRSSLERVPKPVKVVGSPEDYEPEVACPTPEFRMSVLLSRGADSAGGKVRSENKERANSPLLVARRSRDKTALLRQRDTVRIVNETNANNQDEPEDIDSEAEKLSPLLDAATSTESPVRPTPSPPADIDDEELQLKVEVSNDEVTTSLSPVSPTECPESIVLRNNEVTGNGEGGVNLPNNTSNVLITTTTNSIPAGGNTGIMNNTNCNNTATGDDSDYYTPEDPMTTILSPLHNEKERSLDPNSCNGRWIGPREGISLPGTPLSTASHRSSGDSYSSSGSTRLLLSTNDKTTHA
ncbi:mahogunin ring finger 1 [Lycorma delicatula]|uniref:mahogunin ring finger 1 n=1 Tax=Lycorma delicatula TaxID=130591 RepID=UPI003F5146BA